MSSSNIISGLSYFVPGSFRSLGSGAYSCAASCLLRVYRAYYGVRFYASKFSYTEIDQVKDYKFMTRKSPNSFEYETRRFDEDFRRGFVYKVETDSETKIFQRDQSLKGEEYETKCQELRTSFFDTIGSLPISKDISERIFCNFDQNLFEAPMCSFWGKIDSVFYNVLGLTIPSHSFVEDAAPGQSGAVPEILVVQEERIRKITYKINEKEKKICVSMALKCLSAANPDDGSLLSVKVKYEIDLNSGKAQLYYRPLQSFYLTKLVPKMIRRPINSFFFGPKPLSN